MWQYEKLKPYVVIPTTFKETLRAWSKLKQEPLTSLIHYEALREAGMPESLGHLQSPEPSAYYVTKYVFSNRPSVPATSRWYSETNHSETIYRVLRLLKRKLESLGKVNSSRQNLRKEIRRRERKRPTRDLSYFTRRGRASKWGIFRKTMRKRCCNLYPGRGVLLCRYETNYHASC